MHGSIATLLESVRIHEAQNAGNVTVFPLSRSAGDGPDYLSLDEAIARGWLVISERSEGGHVPELLAENNAPQAVLIVSGDELVGARQNRILNVSILLKSGSKVVVPVSCSEKGRWHYTSRTFRSSKFMSSPSLRKKKMETVTRSIRLDSSRRSDQHEIWNRIDEESKRMGVRSKTGAYSDILESRKANFDEMLTRFPLVPGQTGMIVFAGLQPLLFEYISKPAVYARIHKKALSGCLLDAVHLPGNDSGPISTREVIDGLRACEDSEHRAIGDGIEIRFQSPRTEGAALVVDDEPVHMVSCWELSI